MRDLGTEKPSFIVVPVQPFGDSIGHETRCPECGHRENDPLPPRTGSIFNWRVSAPFIAALVASAMLALHIANNANTQTAGPSAAPGASTPWRRANVVIDPAITRAKLVSIERGEDAAVGEHLFREVLKQSEQWFRWAPGEPKVQAGFFDMPPERTRELNFGWPSAWWMCSQVSTQPVPEPGDNAIPIESSNSRFPSTSQVQWGFRFPYVSRTRSFVESHGIPVQSSIRLKLSAIALSLMIVLALTLVLSLAAWLINRRLRRDAARGVRRWLLSSSVLATCCVVGLAIATREDATHAYVMMTSATPATRMENTSLGPADVLQLAGEKDRARVLAREILESTGSMNAGEGACLGFAVVPEAYPVGVVMSSYAPDFLIAFRQTYQFRRRPEFGPNELIAAPAGVHLHCRDGLLIMERTSGDPKLSTTATYVDFGMLSVLVLGLAVVWLLVWAPLRWIDHRVIRGRRRRNQCIACGYALVPMRAAASRSSKRTANQGS